MAITIISSDVQHTVTLDIAPYAAQITVSRRGSILPTGSAAYGVFATAPDAGIINYGTISGGGSPSSPGGGGGISFETSSGTVINYGTISGGGAGGAGVYFGGMLNNSGMIIGGAGGAEFPGGSGVIMASGTGTNTGTIIGGADTLAASTLAAGTDAFGGDGVDLEAYSTFFNQGTILGGTGLSTAGGLPNNDGVLIYDATLINSGTIAGAGEDGTGVTLTNGGLLINQGDVSGAPGGSGVSMVSETFVGTLINAGTISGGAGNATTPAGRGVYMFGGTLINTGLILGGANAGPESGAGGVGVYLAGGTMINAGTVSGGVGIGNEYAVSSSSAASTLIIDPGAVFDGLVMGNGVNDTLELAAAASAGTISGLGTQFTGFATTEVLPGADWFVAGANTIKATAVIDGTLTVAGSTLDLADGTSGTGTIIIGTGATLEVQALTDVADVTFAAGGPGHFLVQTPSLPSSELIGFGAGDTIDLAHIRVRSLGFANGILTLDNASGATIGSLAFLGNYDTANFTLRADRHGGTDIGFTSIATALASGLQDLLAGSSAAPSSGLPTQRPPSGALFLPDLTADRLPAVLLPGRPAGVS
jgi:hypothetical protein